MAAPLHSGQTISNGRHPSIVFEYANATDRANHVPSAAPALHSGTLAAFDIGSFARQTDDSSIWVLTGVGPIAWIQVGGAAVVPSHAPTHQDGGVDEIDVTGLSGLLADGQKALPSFSGYHAGPTAIPAGGVNLHMTNEHFAHAASDYTWTTGNAVTIVNTGQYAITGFYHGDITAGGGGTRTVLWGIAVNGAIVVGAGSRLDHEGGGFTPKNGSAVGATLDLTASDTVSIFASRVTGVATLSTIANEVGLRIGRLS